MNESIGSKDGVNDRRRTLVITKNKKKKLEEYALEENIKRLEKEVKKKQILTLVKVLPIVVLGNTIETLTKGNTKKEKVKLINEEVTVELAEDKDKTIPKIDYSNEIDKDTSIDKSIKDKINKLESKEILNIYGEELKDIRYDLREKSSPSKILKKEEDPSTDKVLDNLSLLIDKVDTLNNKIEVEEKDKVDNNYIYYLVEGYIEGIKDGNTISNLKDSDLYVDISKKVEEAKEKNTSVEEEKKEEKEQIDLQKQIDEYNNIDRINEDLIKFQYDQDRLLKDLDEKVRNAKTIEEKVKYEVEALDTGSKRLLDVITLQLFIPGPRIAKKMAAYSAAYLYLLNQVKYKKTKKKYKLVQVKDYKDDIEDSLTSIDEAGLLLSRTSKKVEETIKDLEKDYQEYLGNNNELDDLINNLNKVKSSLDEKKYSMERLRQKEEKLLENNNKNVLEKNNTTM